MTRPVLGMKPSLLLFAAHMFCANADAQRPSAARHQPFASRRAATEATEARITSLLSRMTLDETIDALGTNPTVPRLGVVGSGHVEGLHGLALGGPGGWQGRNLPVIPTTQFPQARGLGQTWDPAILRQAAQVEAYEARYAYGRYHRGGLVVRAPNADLSRDPRWGRSEESYGEDPYLVGTLATAFATGLQGSDPRYWETASLLKHFLANSNEDGRDGSSSNFDARLFHCIGVVGVGGVDPWNRAAARALVRRVTDESIVLLKNDHHLLPLAAARVKSIAVIGPLADTVALDWYSGTPPRSVSPLEGLRHRVGAATPVSFASGNELEKAVALAKAADVAVVVIGNHPTCNAGWLKCPVPSDGKEAIDRKSLSLGQEALARAVLAANPRTIVVLQASFPYTTTWTQEHAPAILEMTHNSEEQGSALADVLFGDYNPAGRLTQTWVSSIDQLPPMMDYDLRHGRTYLYLTGKPLYAFGYGLSYTTFTYSNLRVSPGGLRSGAKLEVSVDVRNTGSRAGDEVVQMYVTHRGSAVARPIEELKGFRRVLLRGGERKTIILPLDASALAYWSESGKRFVLERDTVEIRVGGSSDNLPLRKTVGVVP